MTEQTAATLCDHAYETRILGGHPISVRLCTLCRTPDWTDLAEQADVLYRWGREEALAGKPLRTHLSAYDMPRDAEVYEPAAVSAPVQPTDEDVVEAHHLALSFTQTEAAQQDGASS